MGEGRGGEGTNAVFTIDVGALLLQFLEMLEQPVDERVCDLVVLFHGETFRRGRR